MKRFAFIIVLLVTGWLLYAEAENDPLYFGNPSNAVQDIESEENFLMVKPEFSLSYNNCTLNPNWVAWHLCAADLGETERKDSFRPDKELPGSWYAVSKTDYKFPAFGFDRGHICPSADRTASSESNSTTFLMTNMVPQTPDNNRIVWVSLENFEREIVKNGNEAYIFAGPLGQGGISDKGYFESIPVSTKDGREFSITVPAFTWKIIMILPEGEDDFSRVTPDTQILAVCVPNVKGCGKDGDWQQYICTINDIEEKTGYDFFDLLPDDLETVLEAKMWNEL